MRPFEALVAELRQFNHHESAEMLETLHRMRQRQGTMSPKAVWEVMAESPALLFAALKAAPKVAGPWEPGKGQWEERYDANNRMLVRAFNDEQKPEIDRQLREAGYILVDE